MFNTEFEMGRRCSSHPDVVISSPCGNFDAVCDRCEEDCELAAAYSDALDAGFMGDERGFVAMSRHLSALDRAQVMACDLWLAAERATMSDEDILF